MAETVAQSLSEDLLNTLQKECLVLLSTMDHETGAPNVSAISWVYAPDSQRLRFAVDNRSRIVENIRKQPEVVFTLFASGTTYSISAHANVHSEKMEGVPLKLAGIETDVREVRDVMFYGARISTEPAYEKTYDLQAAAKLDHQVMTALKEL